MKVLQSILVAMCFGPAALSAPTSPPQIKGRSFKIEKVRRAETLSGPSALRRAYVKYGIVPTNLGIDLSDFEPIVKTAVANTTNDVAEPEQTGGVSATSVEGDAAFVSPMTIGGQQLTVTFDTGSSDLWVMNSQLPAEYTQGRTVFNSSKSSTFKKLEGYTFNITYGDDSYAYGGVGTDTVDVGGVIVTGQAIGVPTTVASSFAQDTYTNGLVGLGFTSLNTVQPQQQPSFFAKIAGVLDEPVLGSSLKSDGVGEFEFGIIDRSKYKGDMVNASVDSSSGFWQFESAYYRVGGGDLTKNTQATATIADTGTSLMLLDQHIVDAYYSQVKGAVFVTSASGYIYPCSAELPNFSIAVGPAHLATVPGKMIDFAQVGTNTTTGEKVCYGGIQSNQGISMQILGDTFLKAFYVVFDLRGPSIGVAAPV
ncbi:hypothetical protein ARAM_001256 [Aspergillus rambellii]|uniref:Peptidase A1 domain-containing protein n=1 Tax=Aspergillus rambellii TaxID=308745 RepID=A0A0F8UP44_9EURO|nr:hypothetical protein ARAM_001256 [Aspergillus rambellii]